VSARLQNIDQESAHTAHCMVVQGKSLIGELRDIALAPSGSLDIRIPVSDYDASRGQLRVRVVADYLGPWASTKVADWWKTPQPHAGRIEVPDLRVLRHEPKESNASADLATIQLRRLIPGRYSIGLTHPSDQSPLSDGHITIHASDGAKVSGTIRQRPAYYEKDLLQESYRILEKTRLGEEGSIFITLSAANQSNARAIDLDRLLIRRIIDQNSWGHDYVVQTK
jgi:hypothetical protein